MNQNFYYHETAVLDDGCNVGEGSKIWHFSHLMAGSTIGKNCNIGQNVYVAATAVLGDGVKVQNNVSIYDGVVCKDNVFIGPSVVFTNVINPRAFISKKEEYKETIVEEGASIGANATIVCGNKIGKYAFVGAGSVVTHDVMDFELVAGVPAAHVGWISKEGYRLEFNRYGIAFCHESKETYTLKGGQVSILQKSDNNDNK